MSVEVEKPAEAHIQYIRNAYDRLNEHTLVKKAKSGYGKTKHSFGLLEKTLDYIEGTAYNATNKIAIPAYESYGYLVTNSLLNLYTRGANLLLDTAIFTKSVSGSAINSALDLEKTVEQRIYLFLERSQKYAQVPADKIAEHGNFFLDIANSVFDRFIGLPAEHEDSNNTIGQRVSRLTKRVISGLSARVHNDVTDSASQKIRYFAGQLNQKLALADLVRQRRDWAFEKYSLVTCSVSDLRDKVANQASQLNILPEKMLLDSIRHTSIKLSENMEKFRNKSSKLLNGGVISSQIESATLYIQHLVSTFSEANDIYQIKDGVLDEAQHRLTEIAQLVSSSFLRHSSVSVDSTSTNDGPILNSSGENSPVDNSPLSSDSGEE